jgi:hypothetical protein
MPVIAIMLKTGNRFVLRKGLAWPLMVRLSGKRWSWQLLQSDGNCYYLRRRGTHNRYCNREVSRDVTGGCHLSLVERPIGGRGSPWQQAGLPGFVRPGGRTLIRAFSGMPPGLPSPDR